jgi:hypothetical protein
LQLPDRRAQFRNVILGTPKLALSCTVQKPAS